MAKRHGSAARHLSRARILGAATFGLTLLTGALAQAPSPRPQADPAGVEFFEKKIRPILEENCTGCHGAGKAMANLRLDQPAGLRRGGPRGPAVVPGDLKKSLIVRAIRYEDHTLMMPPSGRMAAPQIAAIEEWIRRGAPVPSGSAAAPAPAPKPGTTWASLMTERRRHWAYQPVRRPAVPKVKATKRVRTPIDAFVLSKLEKAGLTLSPDADRRTLIRRVTLDLIGLPPTPQEVAAFVADKRPDAYERVVDRLLASPHYGERWARHWLDLTRYGESMGHEFDFDIPGAWRFRDWVIQAFNDDLPYNRFVTEQIAGDLLPNPRRDPKTGWNLSRIGTGFYWLGEGKHSPVDVRQEQADHIDNQIDVLGKTFLGQTLACARCHDHKFDPVPARDYYALYGILKSSRFEQGIANDRDFAPIAAEADTIRGSADRHALAAAWRAGLAATDDKTLGDAVAKTPLPGGNGLPNLASWIPSGEALAVPARAGDLILTADSKKPASALLTRPALHGGLRTLRLEGARRSPTFTLDKNFVYLRLAGQASRVNLVIENFVIIRGPIFDVCDIGLNHDDWRWHRIDVGIWKGRRAYVEVSDSPTPTLSNGGPSDKPVDGWAAIDGLELSDTPQAPADRPNPLAGRDPGAIRAAMTAQLARWEAGTSPATADDTGALAVWNRLLQDGRLDLSPLAPLAQRRAALEPRTPAPVRFPAMCDGPGEDEHVFIRGNHRALGEPAPRLQLAFCFREKTPPPTEPGSGRLELARWITSPQHPLTSRVLVNRLWHHHFGAGIVRSTDDLGHMGERPTHPELLNWLASEFVRQGWSIKKMHRLIVTSTAYRQSSAPGTARAERVDPTNKLLWHRSVRRLEAEAIRDSLLAVSGALKPDLFGPSVRTYLEENTDGRGRPAQGPLDGEGRRSIYLSVRRNFPSAFFQAFDAPTPFTTIGRRTVSNVPAQALVMMNGAFVREMANRWAKRELALPDTGRIDRLYATAFGRPPTPAERAAAESFVAGADTPESRQTAWSDLCHVLFNVKEFVFVR